jgi:hypothetical protein
VTTPDATLGPVELSDLDRWARDALCPPDDADWYDLDAYSEEVPLWEIPSVRRALDRLGAEEVHTFHHGSQVPTGRSRVATAFGVDELATDPGAHHLVQRDGGRALVWLELGPGQADLWVCSDGELDAEHLAETIMDDARGHCSTWRKQAVRFDLASRWGCTHLAPVDPATIVLDEDTATELRRNVVLPATRFEQVRHLVPRRGVLLHGRAGGGKTWATRWVQGHVEGAVTVIVATPLVFGSSNGLVHLFEMARSASPCVVVLDDLDVTIRSRFAGGSDALGELLSRLDGPAAVDGIFVIATTNYLDALDAALTERPGRFDGSPRWGGEVR